MSSPNQIKKKYLAPEVVSYFDNQIDAVESQLAQEALDRQSGDQASLHEAKAYADQKITDLVGGAPEILDTLKEISDALGNDANLASTLAGQISGLQSGLSQEISDRQSGDASTLSSANAYADSKHNEQKTYIDAADALKVSKAGDTMTGKLTLQGGVTLLNDPISGFNTSGEETVIIAPEDAAFRLRRDNFETFITPNYAYVANIDPDTSEYFKTTTFISDGQVYLYDANLNPSVPVDPAQVTTKAYVDSVVGANSSGLAQEIADRSSADSALDARIVALETAPPAMIAHKMAPITVSSGELSFVDCEHEAKPMSLHVFVGRLAVHEGVDYTLSVEGGKTRITWAGSLVNPSGVESIELGDKVYISYMR